MGGEQEPQRWLLAGGRINLATDDERHAYGCRQAVGRRPMSGPLDLDLTESDGQFGLAGFPARDGRQLHRHAARFAPRLGLGEQRRVVSQASVLSGAHQLLHVGRLEDEAFVDVAFAIFDDCDAGRTRFGQGAGAFRAGQPTPAVLLLERLLPALVAFAATARQEEVVDQPKHRPRIGVGRDDRMKGRAQAFLVHPQDRSVLDGEHVPADDLSAGAPSGLQHHLAGRHLGIVQKPRNPHLAGTVAAQQPDADALATMCNQALIQKRPPFTKRASPNSPSRRSIGPSQVRITDIGSHLPNRAASSTRCVNAVALQGRVKRGR